jgi:phospholipid/cholesterol/gamma-HCH transport system substrate-binding protein
LSRATEFKVGLTVLVAIGILIAGVVWLKEMSLHNAKRVWKVSFTQTGGLAASDEVQVNGIRKGQVKSMKLKGDHVIVELELSDDVVITHDSNVAVRNVGLMGEKVIAVDLKVTGAPYTTHDVIEGVYEPGLGDLMGQLGTSVDAMAQLSEQLRDIAMSLRKGGRLENTMRNFDETSEQLRIAVVQNRVLLNETLANFAATSRTAKALTSDREEELKKALSNFSSAAERVDRLAARLDSLSAGVQAGQGTLGRLVQDEKLYDEMRSSIASMKELIDDVKNHPKKYFKFSVF